MWSKQEEAKGNRRDIRVGFNGTATLPTSEVSYINGKHISGVIRDERELLAPNLLHFPKANFSSDGGKERLLLDIFFFFQLYSFRGFLVLIKT